MAIKFFSENHLYIFIIYILRPYCEIFYEYDTTKNTKRLLCDEYSARARCVKRHKSSKHKKSCRFDGENENKSDQQDMASLSFSGMKVSMKGSRIFYRKRWMPISKNKLHSVLGIKDMAKQYPSQSIMLYPVEGEDTLPKSLDQFFDLGGSFERSMHIEWLRFVSFLLVPTSFRASAIRLARAGFFYTGYDESVQCFSCGIKCNSWSENEDPVVVHGRKSPHCRHALNQDQNNVPIQSNSCTQDQRIGQSSMSDLHASDTVRTTDTNSGTLNVNTRSTSHPNLRRQMKRPVSDSNFSGNENDSPTSNAFLDSNTSFLTLYQNSDLSRDERTAQSFQNYQIQQRSDHSNAKMSKRECTAQNLNSTGVTNGIAKYPAYAVTSVRSNSFHAWPSSKRQTPIELASAGFFYSGVEDGVRCFYCGGGLKEWGPKDDPWIEHARWFPNCRFLRQNKGGKFVTLVQKQHQKSIERNKTGDLEENNIGFGEEKESIMDSPAVISVMEMGYTQEQISEALRKTGLLDNDLSGEKILNILMDEEENQEKNPADDGLIYFEDFQGTFYERKSMKSMAAEIQQLRNERLCKVCLDQEANYVILPCGHLCCCMDCVSHLTKCPICRLPIKSTVRTWFS